jgi:hypothetical protein
MKRLGRILTWTAIVAAAAIAILLTLNAYIVWSTGTMLEHRLAVLRQAGNPVQLADLGHEPIAPEKNGDVFLRRTAGDLDALQKELVALYPRVGYPTGPMSPADQDKLNKLFAAYPKVMPLLEQAAACPDFDSQFDLSLPPSRFLEFYMEYTNKRRLIYRVMRARSELLLARGRGDDALATQILVLRLARQRRREPLFIGYFVTLACTHVAMEEANRVLQSGPVSAAMRQNLDAELALHDTMENYKWALLSERAYSLSSIRELPGAGFWLTRGLMSDMALGLIGLFDAYLAKASRPYSEVVAAKAASASSPGPNPYRTLVTLLEPAMVSLRAPAERIRAMSRSLRALNSIQSREAAGPPFESKLTDLGLPIAATIDPFNGEPLRVKRLPEGWIVYSVGENLVDDGGKLDGKTDIGAGPIVPEKSP